MNLAALRSPGFRLYLAGNLFALNARWMVRIIVGWLAWDLTQSAGFVGFVALLYFLPSLFLGPFFGVLTDRVDVRRTAMLVQWLFLASALALWLMQHFSVLTVPYLLLYAAVVGFIMAAHSPVRMSMAPRLVAPESISSAVNFASINYNISRMTGPALGGWSIYRFGTDITSLLAAFCYLPLLLVLIRLRVRPMEKKGAGNFRGELIEGIRYAFSSMDIRLALGLSAISAIFVHGTLEILPVIADGVFRKGASGLGVLTAAGGLGAILSGIGLATLPLGRYRNRLSPVLGFSGLAALCIGSLGQTESWPVAVALVSAMAMAASVSGIVCQSVIQTRIIDEMRGRVMSIWTSVAIGGSSIGAFVLGYAVEGMGLSATLLSAAFVSVCLQAIIIAQRFRRLRLGKVQE